MTSIEWLIQDLLERRVLPDNLSLLQWSIDKAKEMEKEQLEKAIRYGYDLRNNHKPINSGIDWVKEFKKINKLYLIKHKNTIICNL